MVIKDSTFIHPVLMECLLCDRHCVKWFEKLLGTFSVYF